MGKPRLVILIRHAQSEGNKNRDIHQTVPDHRVRLTQEGHQQALEAGRKLRALLRPDDTLHFFTSPYRRTRETTEGILTALTSDDPSPSPFPRHTIKVYEEPRLREQDFGNFQPCSAEMERMWQERADYGHFFYRIPNGESAADAYDRISGFNDSLWRRFEENDFASVCILVTHGLMTRVFLMKWYHFSVEYFEDLRNVNHCEFVVMKKSPDSGKYILQNHLRTWSELKRERAARGSVSQVNLAMLKVADTPIPQRRTWGGCPDGCEHAQHNHGPRNTLPLRKNTADLFRDDNELLPYLLKESSRGASRHNSVKVSGSRPPSRLQSLRERHPQQIRQEHFNHGKTGDLSLPENEDTILDHDPERPPSAPSSAPSSALSSPAKTVFGQRYRFSEAVPMLLDQHLLEEELSPNSRSDDVPTPRAPQAFPTQILSNSSTPKPSPRQEIISPTSLRTRLRHPREAAIIAMVGRDGGGSQSGAASSEDDADTNDEADEDADTNDEADEEDSTQSGDLKEESENNDEYDEEADEEAFPHPLHPSSHTTKPHPTTLPSTALGSPSTAGPKTSIRLGTPHAPPNYPTSDPNTTKSKSNANHTPASSSTDSSPTSHEQALNSPLSRAMADALGDQSDVEVTEDEEEMDLMCRQRGEEERILEAERRERRDGMLEVGVAGDVY